MQRGVLVFTFFFFVTVGQEHNDSDPSLDSLDDLSFNEHLLHVGNFDDDPDFEFDDEFFHVRPKRSSKAFLPYRTGKKLATRVSAALDKLLSPETYSKEVRPSFGAGAVEVTLNMVINSMGPVDERSQMFSLDCYFRQSWRDERLQYNASKDITSLPLNWSMLTRIWKPDTFFTNGMKSKIHKITVPNRFVRITPDGTLSYSQRLTVRARCQMHLLKFPLDSQICALNIGSYGYPAEEVIYKWKPDPVAVGQLEMAQFKLNRYVFGEEFISGNRFVAAGFRNDSVAYLHFFMERQTGYFLLQFYTPILLIVMCSWVGFWIVRTDAVSRSVLGANTVLSIVKIGFDGKGKPQVGYPTALDIYVVICFFLVFAALLEFASINFITLFIKRYKAAEEKKKEAEAKAAEEAERLAKEAEELQLPKVKESENGTAIWYAPMEIKVPIAETEEDYVVEEGSRVGNGASEEDVISLDFIAMPFEKAMKEKKDYVGKFIDAFMMILGRLASLITIKPVPQMRIYRETEESVKRIDVLARKIFPSLFLFSMLVYWTAYLILISDVVYLKNTVGPDHENSRFYSLKK